MSQPFNVDQALKDLQSGKDLTGKDGVLIPLIKQLTEAALQAELESHLKTQRMNPIEGMGHRAGFFDLLRRVVGAT